MNDLGLHTEIRNTLQRVASRNHQDAGYEMSLTSLSQGNQLRTTEGDARSVPDEMGRSTSHEPRRKGMTQNGRGLEHGKEEAYYQPAYVFTCFYESPRNLTRSIDYGGLLQLHSPSLQARSGL